MLQEQLGRGDSCRDNRPRFGRASKGCIASASGGRSLLLGGAGAGQSRIIRRLLHLSKPLGFTATVLAGSLVALAAIVSTWTLAATAAAAVAVGEGGKEPAMRSTTEGLAHGRSTA